MKWWLVGGGVWLVCAGAPALLWIIDDWHSGFPLLWLSATGGLGVLSAILIHPQPRRWLWGVITLIWCFGWIYWMSLMFDAAEFLVDRLVYHRVIYPSFRPIGNFDHQLAVALILSCLITTILLTLLTRSWRVCLLTLIPAAAFAGGWAFGVDAMWDDALWHPLVIGALILWAVPKRIHRFPAHACQSCGYDLRGLDSAAKCPECGAAPSPSGEDVANEHKRVSDR